MTWMLLAVLCVPSARAQVRLEGKVRGKPRVESTDEMSSDYSSKLPRGAKLFDYRRLRHVVVFAEALGGGAPPPPATLEMRAGPGPALEPEFSAAPAGAELRWTNASTATVHLYAGGGSPAAWASALEPGASVSVRLSTPGLYGFYCLEAPGRRAEVFSAGGWAAAVRDDGSYVLDLPPGEYRVTAWHERLPPHSAPATLAEGRKARLDFTLTTRDLPEPK